jgi:hypothetical protein
MITSTCRLGFPFSKIFFLKFSFQISKIRARSELSDLQGNFEKNPKKLWGKVWLAGHTSWLPGLPLSPFQLGLFPLHHTH